MQNYNTRAQYQGQLKVLLIQACIPEFLTSALVSLSLWPSDISSVASRSTKVEMAMINDLAMLFWWPWGPVWTSEFCVILTCLTEKAQVVVLTKLSDPMCHASTCMTVFSHVLFGYSFIANYLETALLILYLQENNLPLTPNIFCLPCKFRGEKTSRKHQLKFVKANYFVKILDSCKPSRFYQLIVED